MLIDPHIHILLPGSLPDGQKLYFARMAAKSRLPYRDPLAILPRVGGTGYDPDGKRTLEFMDYIGTDSCIHQVVDWGPGYGQEAPLSIEEQNRLSCEMAQKHPGKIYSAIGVDPRRGNAVAILEKGVKEWGAKCLKLYPPCGFFPNDRCCYPLYEKCLELGIPVVIHTGEGSNPQNTMPTDPVYIEQPAKDFPDLEFILAHSGGYGLEYHYIWKALTVARRAWNMTLELSSWQFSVMPSPETKLKSKIPEFLDFLNITRSAVGAHRILWATDFHPYKDRDTCRRWAEFFANLPARAAEYDYDFSQEETDLICWGNAKRLFKI
ncbi:MAG: amidohydrolase family protein [Chloroflexi bacterium]|nr:amidohydrolase family protein [Chloroflexota bacterium]